MRRRRKIGGRRKLARLRGGQDGGALAGGPVRQLGELAAIAGGLVDELARLGSLRGFGDFSCLGFGYGPLVAADRIL
jgi:hypothetical protein